MAPSPEPGNTLPRHVPALTLFMVALATLLVQLVLTRVLSVVMWYHFTFAVISFSLLGIAAGAMRCYQKYPANTTLNGAELLQLWQTLLLNFAFSLLGPVTLVSTLVASPSLSPSGLVLIALYLVACMLPFYFSGYLTTTIFRFGGQGISSLYAVDLVGASLGCLLAIPLLNTAGGVGSLLLVGAMLSLGMTLVGLGSSSAKDLAGGVLFAAMFIGGMIGLHFYKPVDIETIKFSSREREHKILESKWNSYSRLAVLDYFDPASGKDKYPFLSWGLSTNYKGPLPRQLLITIDGSSETPIAQFDGDLKKHEYLAWDITTMAYQLRPGTEKGRALVIGSGGGRDLLAARFHGYHNITGVELNRGIVDWLKGNYAEFSGHIYTLPGIQVFTDDGRNFVRSSHDKYNVLQISMIDTFAATAAGAFTLAENNLYTQEAFHEYMDHLEDDGFLTINRYILDPDQQTLRIVTMARAVLASRGSKDPGAHVVVVQKKDPTGNNGLVLVRKTPFPAEELSNLEKLCTERNFEIVAMPGKTLENSFSKFLRLENPDEFIANYPYDITAPVDDRPFFFNTMKLSMLLEAMGLREEMEGRAYNFDALLILVGLLALAVLGLAWFVFRPLLGKGKAPGQLPFRSLLFFIWVGLGYIMLEIVLIQRFNLYLGHPIYSLAVILVSILAFSGLGSFLSKTLVGSDGRRIPLICGLLVLLAMLQEAIWPWFLQSSMGLPLEVRIGLTMLYLLPLGLVMGMPYPLALQAISKKDPEGISWVWSVNAAASVLGSIVAFAMAMAVGFQAVLMAAAACYLGALISARWVERA